MYSFVYIHVKHQEITDYKVKISGFFLNKKTYTLLLSILQVFLCRVGDPDCVRDTEWPGSPAGASVSAGPSS